MGSAVLTASDAAWAWPAGVTSLTAEALGGGGAGGLASNNPANCGGGKGGSYAKKAITKTVATMNITVGAASAASTIVQNGVTELSAAGGATPAANQSAGAIGLVGSNIGDLTYAGGNGGNAVGTNTTSGGGGGAAGPGGVGGAGSGGTAGTCEMTPFLNGLTYAVASGAGVVVRTAGVAGSGKGCAGSGGNTNQATDRAGGAGAVGVVVLTWDDPAAQNVTPSLFTSATAAFYAATVAAGAVALAAGLFANSNSFDAATVAPGAVDLTPSLVANSASFYAPTIEQPGGAQSLTPTRLDGSQTFYAPTVAPGAVSISLTLATNAQAFYAATVAPGVVGLTAATFDNAGSFYAPSVSVDGGPQALTAARYDHASAFYAPVVAADGATQALTASLSTNEAVFYAPTVAEVAAGGGFPWRRRSWHVEIDGERFYFDNARDARRALEQARRDEPQAVATISAVAPKPLPKVRRLVKSAQVAPPHDDEDDIELLLLAA